MQIILDALARPFRAVRASAIAVEAQSWARAFMAPFLATAAFYAADDAFIAARRKAGMCVTCGQEQPAANSESCEMCDLIDMSAP